MSLDKWDSLEVRINRLEKQNRLLRAGWFGCCLTFVCILTMGQARVGNTVEARRFILRGANGEVRAELTTLDGDIPRLILQSSDGEKKTELDPLGVSVSDHGLSGKLPLVHLGSLGIYFTDTQGHMVMELGGAGTSIHIPQLAPVPEITIFDEQGKSIWHAPK